MLAKSSSSGPCMSVHRQLFSVCSFPLSCLQPETAHLTRLPTQTSKPFPCVVKNEQTEVPDCCISRNGSVRVHSPPGHAFTIDIGPFCIPLPPWVRVLDPSHVRHRAVYLFKGMYQRGYHSKVIWEEKGETGENSCETEYGQLSEGSKILIF